MNFKFIRLLPHTFCHTTGIACHDNATTNTQGVRNSEQLKCSIFKTARARIVISLWLFISTSLLAGSLKTTLDRSIIGAGETITLQLSIPENNQSPLDLTPLQKTFRVLSESQQTHFSSINGHHQWETQWDLILQPKKLGKLTIPALKLGPFTSTPLTVNVTDQTPQKTTANKPYFIETFLEPHIAYLGSEIRYRVKLFYQTALFHVNWEMPKHIAFQPIKDNDRSYDAIRQGEHYHVFERHYLIEPQKEGTLNIPSPHITVTIQKDRSDLLDELMQPEQRLKLVGTQQILNVKPLPNDARLAAASLQLNESWSDETGLRSPVPPSFNVGEPITRILTLEADGVLANRLPILQKNLEGPIRYYPDKPILKDTLLDESIKSTRQERIVLIPQQSGKITLPALSIRWWNTKRHQIEELMLPARTITVSPVSHTLPLKDPAKTLPVKSTWKTLAFLFFGLWLITFMAILLYFYQKKTKRFKKYPSKSQLATAVITACHTNDPKAAMHALLQWARYHRSSIYNLNQLIRWLSQMDLPITNWQTAINELDAALYGSIKFAWQGASLKYLFELLIKQMTQQKKRTESLLPPLYPNK